MAARLEKALPSQRAGYLAKDWETAIGLHFGSSPAGAPRAKALGWKGMQGRALRRATQDHHMQHEPVGNCRAGTCHAPMLGAS